jgi:hypothetical protein
LNKFWGQPRMPRWPCNITFVPVGPSSILHCSGVRDFPAGCSERLRGCRPPPRPPRAPRAPACAPAARRGPETRRACAPPWLAHPRRGAAAQRAHHLPYSKLEDTEDNHGGRRWPRRVLERRWGFCWSRAKAKVGIQTSTSTARCSTRFATATPASPQLRNVAAFASPGRVEENPTPSHSLQGHIAA